MRSEVRQLVDEAAARLSARDRAIVGEVLRGVDGSPLRRAELDAQDASGETGRRYGAGVAGVLRLALEGLAAEESGDGTAWEAAREPAVDRDDALRRIAAVEAAGDRATAARIREALTETDQEEAASRAAAAEAERAGAEALARRTAYEQRRTAASQAVKDAEAALARAREAEVAAARPPVKD